MLANWQRPTGGPVTSSACARNIHAQTAHRLAPESHISAASRWHCSLGWQRTGTSLQQAKRRRTALFVVSSQQDDELERSIQKGLDEQSLRAAAIKHQAEGFKDSNDKLEELADHVREGLGGTSIYLVGMMGSGKSTVGKLVADALDYPLLDSDEVAEEFADCTIAEIFKNEGEEAFRDLESRVLQELMPFKSCVVSTGGGAVERRKNWGYMQHGVVIWLDGSPELLARRTCNDGQDSRPMLGNVEEGADKEAQVQNAAAKLSDLLDRRRDQYAQADIKISLQGRDSNGASLPEVASRLLEALQERLEADKASKGKKPGREFKGFGPSP